MSRILLALSCVVVLGCSGTRSSSGEPTRPPLEARSDNATAAPADPREIRLAATVVELLEKHHLKQRRLDDEVSRIAFDLYIDRLDPGKLFLLRDDVEQLRRYALKIDDELHDGRLDLAHEGEALFAARLEIVKKLVADLLAQPFDSSDEEWIELDAKKVERAASVQELRDRWRRQLEAEVLERVALMEDRLAAAAKPKPAAEHPIAANADPIPATPEARDAKARADLAVSYQARFTRLGTPDGLAAAADLVNAVTAVFDPHTDYLPPSDKANFDIQMSGSLEGIGAVLREDDHYVRVAELVPGGSSWRDGKLEQGDLILAVAQQGADPVDIADMRIDEVVKMVRGPKGTVVTLTVQKASGEIQNIAITRDVVVIEDAYARGAILHHKKVKPALGYIQLPSFYGGRAAGQRTAAGDVRRLLAAMAQRKVPGIIIDLRGNGGGLLGDAVEMTGLLIDRGPVVQTERGNGERKVLGDEQAGTTFDGQVVVLVDRFSASASEIVAGALQDYGRAVIVGTGPTHGKGTVQMVAPLDESGELGVVKLTVEQFFRVSGSSTQWQGVVPDISLPDPTDYLKTREKELERSIPWSSIDAASYDRWRSSWKLDVLAAHSAARVAKNEALSGVAARTELLRKRQDETRLPLARAAWMALRQQQRAAVEAMTADHDGGQARLTVDLLAEGQAAAAPRASGKTDDRLTRFRDSIARDPWLEEALLVLADLTTAPTP